MGLCVRGLVATVTRGFEGMPGNAKETPTREPRESSRGGLLCTLGLPFGAFSVGIRFAGDDDALATRAWGIHGLLALVIFGLEGSGFRV